MQKAVDERTGLWPDVATARLFLNGLVTGKWSQCSLESLQAVDQDALARWLIRHNLAPLACKRCLDAFPDLASRLASGCLPAAAWNIVRFHELSQVLDSFCATGIPTVLLKGAALAGGAYGGLLYRPMGDVDLWLKNSNMQEAATIMQRLGFQTYVKECRPPALQLLSRGEIQFHKRGSIELHWSPFPGWWLRRTAVVDDGEIWQRTEPLDLDIDDLSGERPPASKGRPDLVRQLSAEDTVIQVAVHLAVNHQFGLAAARGLMDVALTVHTRSVDWAAVVERARRWRVKTVLWVVLDLAENLIGLPDVGETLTRLHPSVVRRVLLSLLVSPTSVLEGRDLRGSSVRYLMLILLVDRPWDAACLMFRTLWPEKEWLKARYGEQWSRWRHLWNVIRHRQV